MPPARGPINVKPAAKPKVLRPTAAPPKPSVFTQPLGNAAAPILKAQRQAHQNTGKALRKVEARTSVPYVPKLAKPTQAQRGAAQSLVAGSLHRQGINTPAQVQALPKAQRDIVNRAARYGNDAATAVSIDTARRAGATGSPAALAKLGRLIYAKNASRIEPGPTHTRLHIPGLASIDLTNAEHGIADALKGNQISAIIKGAGQGIADTAKMKGAIGLVGRGLQDAVDLPASTATSLYYVGRDAAGGHLGKAAGDLANPIIHTIEHPVQSFSQHPLNTVLIFRGIKGAAGHAAGTVMRSGALGSTAKAAAGTERAPLTIPGAQRVIRRQYNRDPTTKAVQVATEKYQARRAARKGNPAPTQASEHQVRRLVAEDVAANKIIANKNAGRVAHQAKQALGYKRGRGPTAATNLVAQGVTTASEADLRAYLGEIQRKGAGLKGDMLKRNQDTQKLIVSALKNHDPVKVQQAASAYQQLVATELEPRAVAAHLVEPTVAEQTRLAGVTARRVNGAKPMAAHGQKVAQLEVAHATAAFEQAVADAKTAARVNGGRIPPPQHDALLRAIERRDNAQNAVAQIKQTRTQGKIARAQQQLQPGEQPAYVSQQPIPARTPALPTGRVTAKVKAQRTGQGIKAGTLDVHPVKLVEQAAQTSKMIDAAGAHERFVEDYGYRPAAGEPVKSFDNSRQAAVYAEKQGLDYKPMRRQDGSTVLVHAVAHDEAKAFERGVNTAPALKGYTSRWRRVVLAFSPRWLAGNTFEAAFRSLIAGAGPASYATARRNLTALHKVDPHAASELEARALGGGNYTAAQNLARERVTVDELGRMGKAMHAFGSLHGPRELGQLYGAYTHFVFQTLNGRIEHAFQTALLGKAMRQHPVVSEHIVGLSQKAAEQAAHGLRDTATQVELARQVDRAYGRYGKMSPGAQNAVANYTPFIAWSLNAVNFLYHVLPADHPVLTGLLASANEASMQWRKQHGLYLDALGRSSGQLPGWLQGSVPGSAGSHLRVSRYLPSGVFATDTGPLGNAESLLLPQVSEIIQNSGGKDWTGKPLSKNPNVARGALAAAVSLIEGQVPVTQQIAHVAGVHLPNQKDGTKTSGSVGTRVREQFDPLRYTPAKKPTGRKSGGGSGWGSPSTGKSTGWGSPSSSGKSGWG